MEIELKLDGMNQKITYRMLDPNNLEVECKGKLHQVVIKRNEAGEIFFTLGSRNYRTFASEIGENRFQVTCKSRDWVVEKKDPDSFFAVEGSEESEAFDKLFSPFPGKVIKLMVEVGQTVEKGETLMIMEAMKLETSLFAKEKVIVEEILVSEGENIDGEALLMKLEAIS
ncbi:MAG: hypothetical protein GY786_01335 [Proteobacteria bacterium]|nr:hypothetical protein [Pseudomonadota bacterium]